MLRFLWCMISCWTTVCLNDIFFFPFISYNYCLRKGHSSAASQHLLRFIRRENYRWKQQWKSHQLWTGNSLGSLRLFNLWTRRRIILSLQLCSLQYFLKWPLQSLRDTCVWRETPGEVFSYSYRRAHSYVCLYKASYTCSCMLAYS